MIPVAGVGLVGITVWLLLQLRGEGRLTQAVIRLDPTYPTDPESVAFAIAWFRSLGWCAFVLWRGWRSVARD